MMNKKKEFISKHWKTGLIILLVITCGYFYITRKVSENKIIQYETTIKNHEDSLKILGYALGVNETQAQDLSNKIDKQQKQINWQNLEYNKLKNKFSKEVNIAIHMNTPESITLLEQNLNNEIKGFVSLEIIRDSMVVLQPIQTKTVNKIFVERNQYFQQVELLEQRIELSNGIIFTLNESIGNKNERIDLLDGQIGQQDGIITNKDQIIKQKDKRIRRNKLKHLLTGTAIGSFATVVLILAL